MSTFPLNTMLRWKLDEKNRRSAVQTKKGILQVKCITDGETDLDPRFFEYDFPENWGDFAKLVEKPPPAWWRPHIAKKTAFADFMAWHASLPSGGSITITPYISSSEKKMRPLEGVNDIQKMHSLSSRFDIAEPKYHYRQEALLIIGDIVKKIYTEKDWSVVKTASDDPNYYIRVEGDEKRYNTFAEIGDCLDKNGKPKITVNYRKKSFSVTHLF